VAAGARKKKYQNRRTSHLSAGAELSEIDGRKCTGNLPQMFGYEVKGQAVYKRVKTTPSLLVVGTNRSFLIANAYTLGIRKEHKTTRMSILRATFIVVGKMVEKRFVSARNRPLEKRAVSGHTLHDRRNPGRKGKAFGQTRTTCAMMPITRFFEDFGVAKRTVNIATQAPSH